MPFIWAYRRDYLHPLMTRKHLWAVFLLEEDWDRSVASKLRFQEEVTALSDAAQAADAGVEDGEGGGRGDVSDVHFMNDFLSNGT